MHSEEGVKPLMCHACPPISIELPKRKVIDICVRYHGIIIIIIVIIKIVH